MNLSANFHVWQDFLPVRKEKNLSGRLFGVNKRLCA